MRITYRRASVKDYWTRRWAAVEADDASENPDGYPLKYAEITVAGEPGRVLEPGGRVCASFRADNAQTRLTDWLAELRAPGASRKGEARHFHKANLTSGEFRSAFERAGFAVESLFPVENMPIFYKFAVFRAPGHKVFDENMARREGYRLSRLGQILQDTLMRFFPNQFCNIYVIVARKPAGA